MTANYEYKVYIYINTPWNPKMDMTTEKTNKVINLSLFLCLIFFFLFFFHFHQLSLHWHIYRCTSCLHSSRLYQVLGSEWSLFGIIIIIRMLFVLRHCVCYQFSPFDTIFCYTLYGPLHERFCFLLYVAQPCGFRSALRSSVTFI